MQKKMLLLLILCSVLSGCSSMRGDMTELELQEQMSDLSRKYDAFTTIGDYVQNAVAIYGCTFTPAASGGVSNIKVKKLYDSLDGKYDKSVTREMQKQTGSVFLPTKGKKGHIYGKIYCFQKEKWPGSEMHVPCTFIIYDGLIHQGSMNCTREEFLAWVKKLHE